MPIDHPIDHRRSVDAEQRAPARRLEPHTHHHKRAFRARMERAGAWADHMMRGRILAHLIGKFIGGRAGRESETQLRVVRALHVVKQWNVSAKVIE